jgi:hypothetical protein
MSSVSDDREAPVEWLQSIHRELVEAFADARRARRIDQLLEVASALMLIADAVRVDWADTSGLIGQPRDAGRVTLLVQELDLRHAGLVALGGPVLAGVKHVVGMVNSPASIDSAVHDAIGEIKSTLATERDLSSGAISSEGALVDYTAYCVESTV